MRIKRLELVGFKSFVEPTVFDFDASVAGVVGPNGCGKSNVVDAIRWVMGEMSAKSLRGRSMEDVIFNGSEKRAPLGMTEVSLTFSTEDGIAPPEYASFSEITVTRRLYRSGESEYLINKVSSRLRDVVDLFLGTGVGHRAYSIIEQGKIDFVINAKPEERRLLLEEAAGVSKFKARKESALRKMEGTEQNVSRLKDILHEVTRQINSLDRQVRKAERFKTLKNEMRELDLKLSSLDYLELCREMSELKGLLDDWTARETRASAELATLESDLERGRLELVEEDRGYNSLQERNFEVSSRLQLLEAQNGFRQKEIKNLEEAVDGAHREIVALKGRLETLCLEKEEQEKRGADLEAESGGSLALLDECEKDWMQTEADREALCQELERKKENRRQAQSEIQRIDAEKRLYDERQIASKGQLARLEVEQEEEGRRLARQKQALEEKAKLLRDLVEQCLSDHAELEGLKEGAAAGQERRDLLAQELKIRGEELVLKRSRLKSLLDLERNFEGYDEGVRSILRKKKEGFASGGEGIFGVVADYIETSPRYEMAVSAALGEKLEYVIVRSHEEGIEAINFLKAQASGRSSFIPVEIRDYTTGDFPCQQSGVIGPILNHVRIREDFRRVGQFLLGDVVLVESLGDALSLWRSNGHRKTLVTLEGEVLDPCGVVSGGTTGIRGKILLEKKREINELRALTAELEEEIGLKEDAHSQVEGSLSEIMLNQSALSKRLQEKEIRRMTLSSEVQFFEEECRRIEAACAKLAEDLGQIRLDLRKGELDLTQGETRRTDLLALIADRDRDIASGEAELAESDRRGRQVQESLTALRVDAASLTERRGMIDRERERLKGLEEQLRLEIDQKITMITESHQKRDLLSHELEKALQEIESLKKMAGDLAVAQEEARRSYETLAASLKEKEERIRSVRKENDLSKSHTGDLRVTLSRTETEICHLDQKIVEKYSVVLSEMAGSLAPEVDFDREAEQERLVELRAKLDQMGDVNLGAIPEYAELKQRQEFLSRQIEDLEESLEALRKAIHRINQTTRKRFELTFQMVNERFQTLFPRLFEGGRAELRLSEGEEGQGLLNAGVELLVQPPGKKLSHIGLLSGGEKAMSAVAFVFSIFLVKPSPFCILDEVDAPLDDLNTVRFHNLLSEMTPRIQFILITHNRRTMERCDLLYGVTMMEPGASQLVSVRMNEALKLAS